MFVWKRKQKKFNKNCLYYAELYQKFVSQFFSHFLKLNSHTEKVLTRYLQKTKKNESLNFAHRMLHFVTSKPSLLLNFAKSMKQFQEKFHFELLAQTKKKNLAIVFCLQRHLNRTAKKKHSHFWDNSLTKFV